LLLLLATSFLPNLEAANKAIGLKASHDSTKNVEHFEVQEQAVNNKNQETFAFRDDGVIPQIEGVNEVTFFLSFYEILLF
jgi:hypothetical protein